MKSHNKKRTIDTLRSRGALISSTVIWKVSSQNGFRSLRKKTNFPITRLICQYLTKDIPVNNLALVHLINKMISFEPVWIQEKWACTCFPPWRNLTYGSLVPLVSLVWVFTNSSAQNWINPSAVYFAGRSWPCLRWTTRWKLENCWAAARSSTLSKVGVVIIVTKKETMKINTWPVRDVPLY